MAITIDGITYDDDTNGTKKADIIDQWGVWTWNGSRYVLVVGSSGTDDGTMKVGSMNVSSYNDLVYGGSGDDKIYGGRGKDRLYGDAGDDVLYGDVVVTAHNTSTGVVSAAYDLTLAQGASSDVLIGGQGNDTAYGGEGDDQLFGGQGKDLLYGDGGNDTLYGGEGKDTLHGGLGDDSLDGGTGRDDLRGGDGKDTLYGGKGADTLDGGLGDDKLYGGQGEDKLVGGDGNDALDGGKGGDLLTGGTGDDRFVYNGKSDSPFTAGWGGWDEITDLRCGLDKIDLTKLTDPATTADDLIWGNTTATAHGVWYEQTAPGTYVVYINLGGAHHDDDDDGEHEDDDRRSRDSDYTTYGGSTYGANDDGSDDDNEHGDGHSVGSSHTSAITPDMAIIVHTVDGQPPTAADFLGVVAGANSAPALSDTTDPAAVDELINAAAQDLAPITGSFAVADVDVGNTLTPTVVGAPTVLLDNVAFSLPAGAAALIAGSAFMLTGASSNGGSVNIGYTYNPTAANLDFLDEGQSLTITYVVQVSDGVVSSGTQNITITITGTNDDAIVTVVDVTDTEADVSTPASFFIANQVSQTDADTQDATFMDYVANSGSFAAAGSNGATPPLTGFSLNAATGEVSYDRGAFNFLDSDQSVTYTITFKTTSGDDAEQTNTIDVTINGENDDAIVTVVDVTDTEADVSTPASFFIANQVSQTDADTQDATFMDYVANSGSFAAAGSNGATPPLTGFSLNAATGEVSYDRGAFNFLDSDQSVTYTITFKTTSGDDAEQTNTIDVTINGENDRPVVAVADVTGAVTELTTPVGSLTDTGTIAFTDVDLTDSHSLSAVTPSGGALGTLTASVSTDTTGTGLGGVVTWNYSVAASAVEFLAAGQTKVETFSFNVLDGNSGSVPRTVSVTITGTNDAPTVTGLVVTGTTISFVASDVDNATLSLASPFAAAFGNPTITSGATTNLVPSEQGSVVTGTLQVRDSAGATADVVGLYLGTSAGNTASALLAGSPTAMYGFGGDDSLTGGTAADWIFGGSGNDTIVGAQNDTLLDGGTNTGTGDTLQVGSTFTSTSDGQIASIENVVLTAAVALNLSNQTEAFAITGSGGNDTITSGSGSDSIDGGAGADSINAGGGNDTIVGAANDTLLDGGAGAGDTLNVGANLTSTGDAQIANIENVVLTAAVTLDLSNQTEGFTITGSGGADSITGGSGADAISAGAGNDTIVGAQNDTLLDGGANTDTLNVGASFTSTSNGQIANIENVTLTASGLTLTLTNQTEGFNINGSSGADTIIAGGGADTINGQAGNDSLTGNGGADQFRLRTNGGTDTITDYTDNADKIGFLGGAVTGGVNFTNTVASSAGTQLNASDLISRNSINNINNNDDNAVDVISAAQTTAQITGTNGGNATNTYVIVFNSDTGKGEIWFDDNWNNTAGRVQVATLNNVTSLAGVTAITNTDIVVYDSTLGPAGVAGSAINLGLTDVNVYGAPTVTISGVPADWVLSQGINNGDGTWTVDTSNLGALSVTTPADYTGAMVLPLTYSWTNGDGGVDSEVVRINVEVYAQGAPIFALSSDDNLTGSSGDDTFVFAQPIGNNVIHSFNAAADKIDLIGFAGVAAFADLSIANDENGNAVVTISNGQTVTLSGVDAAALSAGNFEFDVDPVTVNVGLIAISDGAIMPFGGSIVNSGTISLDSTGGETSLEILFRGATLTGGGQVVLSDNDNNVIFGGSADTVLTNVDNTITGAGQLGAGQMTLVNEGAIVANGSHALVIDTGSNLVVNDGTMESTGSGGLIINGDLSNNGMLWANNGNITVAGTVDGSGYAVIEGSAQLEFGAASSENTTFAATGDGTLKLDQSADYSGTVSGFNEGDRLMLSDLLVDADTTLTFAENQDGTGGLLTVSDGTHTANVAMAGDYDAAGFHVAADSSGASVISYLLNQTQPII